MKKLNRPKNLNHNCDHRNLEIHLINSAWKAVSTCEIVLTKHFLESRFGSFSDFYEQVSSALGKNFLKAKKFCEVAEIASLALGPGQKTKYRALSVAVYPANRGSLEGHLSTGGHDLIHYVASLTLAGAVYEILMVLQNKSGNASETSPQPGLAKYIRTLRR